MKYAKSAAIIAASGALAGCATTMPPAAAGGFAPDCAAVRGFLDDAAAQGRIAGASALVWHRGREACFESAGVRSFETRAAYDRETLVQIYSMTKPVTGVALMQLWEQGRFGLDDPLEDHLPEYAALRVFERMGADGVPVSRPPARKVTIRDVLRHTAGFTYGNAGHPSDPVWDALQPLALQNTLAEFSQKMAQVPLLFDPGTHWQYSAGVDVQARLVEVLSGMAFADYVDAHVFTPLGMNDTGWKRQRSEIPRLARIYMQGEGPALAPMPEAQWLDAGFAGHPMTMGGAGLVSTIDDYMRFARMLLGEGALGEARILRPETVRLMATDQLDPRIGADDRMWLGSKGTGGFGFDFFVRTNVPQTAEENRGTVGEFFWDGFASTLFWVDPAQDMAVVFLPQKIPFDNALHHDFRDAVYGAGYTGAAPPR